MDDDSRVVVGLGEAVLSPAALSLISDYFPPARRGTAVGFFLGGVAMGVGAAFHRSRGLAMSVSLFLNVALGAGLGPTAVALASDHVFGSAAGLGPADYLDGGERLRHRRRGAGGGACDISASKGRGALSVLRLITHYQYFPGSAG
jgi:MFS family permease